MESLYQTDQSLRYSAKTKRDGQTDRRTDRPSRAFGAAGDNKNHIWATMCQE